MMKKMELATLTKDAMAMLSMVDELLCCLYCIMYDKLLHDIVSLSKGIPYAPQKGISISRG